MSTSAEAKALLEAEVERLRRENLELRRVIADLEPLARELAGILKLEVDSWPAPPYRG